MKKIMLLCGTVTASLLLSGCGNTEMLTCTSETTTNGMVTKETYKIEYKDNDVKKMKITPHYTYDNTADGVETGTDGSAVDNNNTNDKAGDVDTSSHTDDSGKIVDGALGDAIDSTIDAVTTTILDISGIKDTYNNQMNTYNGIKGFSSKVEVDKDDEYEVVYNIDFNTISDTDLTNLNLSRDLDTLRTGYENQGLTCK